MVSDCQDRIVSLRHREFRDEVEGYSFERESFWLRIYGTDWCLRRTCVDFVPLAFCTSSDIIGSVFLKLGPPIVPFKQSYGSINSQVTVYRGIVM